MADSGETFVFARISGWHYRSYLGDAQISTQNAEGIFPDNHISADSCKCILVVSLRYADSVLRHSKANLICHCEEGA